MQNDSLIIHTDGGSRGNPGVAACAFTADLNGKKLQEESEFLGITTNNVAEYSGVILALKWILENGDKLSYENIIFFLDSELVVRQLTGVYKIKKPELQELSLIIKNNIAEINKKIFFKNVPREQNKSADFLVNRELDNH